MYKKHELLLPNNSSAQNSNLINLYLCSDGFQDQFGGKNDKKFMVGALKKLLSAISDKSMTEQKQILAETFEDWKGERKQTDDVLVVGLRLGMYLIVLLPFF